MVPSRLQTLGWPGNNSRHKELLHNFFRAFGIPVRVYTHEVVTLWYRYIHHSRLRLAIGLRSTEDWSYLWPELLRYSWVLPSTPARSTSGPLAPSLQRWWTGVPFSRWGNWNLPPTLLVYLVAQGDSEIDQLFRIFRVLRTPNEDLWPGVTQLPDFKVMLPNCIYHLWGQTDQSHIYSLEYHLPNWTSYHSRPSPTGRQWTWRHRWRSWSLLDWTCWTRCW